MMNSSHALHDESQLTYNKNSTNLINITTFCIMNNNAGPSGQIKLKFNQM